MAINIVEDIIPVTKMRGQLGSVIARAREWQQSNRVRQSMTHSQRLSSIGGGTLDLWRLARQRIMGQIYQLRDFPERGRRTHETPDDNRRELIVTPYRILYRVIGDTVIFLAIVDARYAFSDPQEDETED
jgi:plasmid stabilization system protein ParE